MQALGGVPVSTRWWTRDAAERPPENSAMTVNSIAIVEKATS